MSLQTLGQRHGTDKYAHGYLPIYERHIDFEVRSLLEIGVFSGNSLRMWRDRFPHAQIYGLDIDPSCREQAGERIDITIASQDDRQALRDLIARAHGFDVVIDDGSHVNELMIKSFETLWPATRKMYAIEDLANSYRDLTPHVGGWPGMEHNSDVDYRNDRSVMDRFFMERVAAVDSGEMSAVHFYPMLAVLMR